MNFLSSNIEKELSQQIHGTPGLLHQAVVMPLFQDSKEKHSVLQKLEKSFNIIQIFIQKRIFEDKTLLCLQQATDITCCNQADWLIPEFRMTVQVGLADSQFKQNWLFYINRVWLACVDNCCTTETHYLLNRDFAYYTLVF